MDIAHGIYAPDYAVPPGETLIEVLEERGLSQAELARRAGLSAKHVNQIVNNRAPISVEVAIVLERVTGVSDHVWNNLESRYQERRAFLEESDRLRSEVGLLEELPIAAMVKAGLLTKRQSPVERLREIYQFFGVADREALIDTWDNAMASFRLSRTLEPRTWAIAVWLRIGELEAEQIPTQAFNITAFESCLSDVRTLTREEDPAIWQPLLTNLCSEAGVAVVVVDESFGARVHGATRWLAPGRALIQLSIRYRWSDIFWFTFFHEAKHILDQSKRGIIVESAQPADHRSKSEIAADRFAAEVLIPPSFARRLAGTVTEDQIQEAADELDIHPGIVVGRLQHEGILAHNQRNDMRQRLAFTGTT